MALYQNEAWKKTLEEAREECARRYRAEYGSILTPPPNPKPAEKPTGEHIMDVTRRFLR